MKAPRIWARLVAALSVAAVALLGASPVSRIEAAPTPSWYTWSFYVTSLDPTTAYNLGYEQGRHDRQDLPGNQNSVVVLAFGQPTYESGSYGTYYYANGAPFASTAQIAEVAKQFGYGYWVGTGSETGSFLTVAIGTSNLGARTTFSNHGAAWAQMVNSVHQWYVDNGYATQVKAEGASDMELAWNGPTTTRSWVDGYDSANNRALYDFGNAAGCPTTGSGGTNGLCQNGWTQDDVWYKSWGASPSYPLPEIYLTNGDNAWQWQKVSLYGAVSKGGRLGFLGSMAQQGACQQKGTCDPSEMNSPDAAWSQLWDALNSDTRTAQDLSWSTDIRYQ